VKRDFSAVVKDMDGKPHVRAVMKYDGTTGMPIMVTRNGQLVHDFDRHEPMTLRTYAMDALAGRWPMDPPNIERGVLTHRVRLYDKLCFAPDAKAVELETHDLPVILDALYAQGVSALVYARIDAMLGTDPKPDPA
jgi:hypothetical protein